MCKGKADITTSCQSEAVKMGETDLIPAQANEVAFNSKSAKLLEIY